MLLSNITNLAEINIVSGNHDRMSASNRTDTRGEGAKLLAYMLGKDFPKTAINFNSIVLVREIDGIMYIMTHGHNLISRKDPAKVVFDYGDSSKFNLWTEGHRHTRLTTKVYKYEKVEAVTLDEQKYRKIVIPPLFTGDYYSESIGAGATAGLVVTENNGSGYPNVYDYTI